MGSFVRQRYAIYTRQSGAGAATIFSSCDAQFEICREFMACYGSSVEWIGERLDDVDCSGADTNRPAFKRLIQLVRAREIQKLVIYRLDRLTRSLLDGASILSELQQNSVALIIVTAPEIGAAASDRLVLNLMTSFAEFEREMISSRIAESRAYLRGHGRRLAGRVPYGFDADPRTKQLVVNRAEAERVEAMFKMAAEGITPKDISAAANENGWRTKITTARRSGHATGGGAWTPRQILSLLSNPTYLGRFADGANTRAGNHEAIVTQELFDRARKYVDARRTPKQRRIARPELWPLRGKIFCACCGRIMSTHTTRKGRIIYRHYRCRSHAGGRAPCKGQSLPAYEIECVVAERISNCGNLAWRKSASEEFHHLLTQFQTVWAALEPVAQRRMLPAIVRSVVFDKKCSKLSVEIDTDAIRRAEVASPQEATTPSGRQ